jgi:hypothetical protein
LLNYLIIEILIIHWAYICCIYLKFKDIMQQQEVDDDKAFLQHFFRFKENSCERSAFINLEEKFSKV